MQILLLVFSWHWVSNFRYIVQPDFTQIFINIMQIFSNMERSQEEIWKSLQALQNFNLYMYINSVHIPCVIVIEDANWDLMISNAISLQVSAHKAKSRVLNHWKESFMGFADWCIPVGLEHLLLWRESFDFGVIILTVQLPNVFNCFSVLCEISKVKWCTILLMVYSVFVLMNSHWFIPLVRNLSHVQKTCVFVLAYVLTWWP